MKTKNLFFSMLAMSGMLFATSCSQNELLNEASNGDFVNATFTIGTADGIGTRTVDPVIGKGLSVNYVACAVFDKDGKELEELRDYEVISTNEEGKQSATYDVRLAKGQDYRVVFFAYNGDAEGNSDYYNLEDLTNIIVKDNQLSNVEARDAFTNYEVIEASTTLNSINRDVVLKRPFAQLNLGIDTEEYNAAKAAGVVVEKSYIKVSNVYNAFNAYENAVVEGNPDAPMVFEMNDIPSETLLVDANENGTFDEDEKYTYLAMNYLLVGNNDSEEKDLTNVEFVWTDQDGKTNNPSTKFINIPVQRNYRTNIIGKLLTSPALFNITIDADFINSPADDKNFKIEDTDNDGVMDAVVEDMQSMQDVINDVTGQGEDGEVKPGTYRFSFDGDMTDGSTGRAVAANEIIIPQIEGVNLIIDGCGYKFDGTFYIHGGARNTGAETLTFTNINFVHIGDGALDFISSNSTESDKRYAHNVTVENCTFTGNDVDDVVGMRYRQTYNMTVKNVTVTGMHSLMWATGGNGISIDNATIKDSKNGVSFGTSTNLTVENSNITAEAYGLRADGSSAASLTVKNTAITAKQPIIVRNMTADYAVALEGENALNTTEKYHVVFTNGSDDAEYAAPTGTYSITGAEGFLVYPADINKPVIATSAAQLTAFLADAEIAEIQLAAGATFEGTFKVNRAVTVSSVDADNKATIKGRVDIKEVNGNVKFSNVKFSVNDASTVKWTTGSGLTKSYPSIVMAGGNNDIITFDNCDFELTTSASAYSNATSGKGVFKNCKFNGSYRYPIYARANIEISDCSYSSTMTDVIAGANVSSIANGKVVFVNNKLNNGANIELSTAILFITTNNTDGVWAGPVEFTVKNNTGFGFNYEKVNGTINAKDHTFTEGSETFELK